MQKLEPRWDVGFFCSFVDEERVRKFASRLKDHRVFVPKDGVDGLAPPDMHREGLMLSRLTAVWVTQQALKSKSFLAEFNSLYAADRVGEILLLAADPVERKLLPQAMRAYAPFTLYTKGGEAGARREIQRRLSKLGGPAADAVNVDDNVEASNSAYPLQAEPVQGQQVDDAIEPAQQRKKKQGVTPPEPVQPQQQAQAAPEPVQAQREAQAAPDWVQQLQVSDGLPGEYAEPPEFDFYISHGVQEQKWAVELADRLGLWARVALPQVEGRVIDDRAVDMVHARTSARITLALRPRESGWEEEQIKDIIAAQQGKRWDREILEVRLDKHGETGWPEATNHEALNWNDSGEVDETARRLLHFLWRHYPLADEELSHIPQSPGVRFAVADAIVSNEEREGLRSIDSRDLAWAAVVRVQQDRDRGNQANSAWSLHDALLEFLGPDFTPDESGFSTLFLSDATPSQTPPHNRQLSEDAGLVFRRAQRVACYGDLDIPVGLRHLMAALLAPGDPPNSEKHEWASAELPRSVEQLSANGIDIQALRAGFLELRQQATTRTISPLYYEWLGVPRPGDEPTASQMPQGTAAQQVSVLPTIRDSAIAITRLAADAPTAEDHLDRRNQAQAFAWAMRSVQVTPPLSIGLFGDWGSGKSSFMKLIESEIIGLDSHGDLRRDLRAWAWADHCAWKLAPLVADPDGDVAAAIDKLRQHRDSSWSDDGVELVRRRILAGRRDSQIQGRDRAALTDEIARDLYSPRYCHNVAQIWFNAWHYAEDNLWASLVTHLFDHLAEAIGGKEDKARTRAGILQELEVNKEAKREYERALSAAQKKTKERRTGLESKLTERRAKRSELAKALLRHIPANAQLGPGFERTLKDLGIDPVVRSVDELQRSLTQLDRNGRDLGQLIRSVQEAPQAGLRIAFMAVMFTAPLLASMIPPELLGGEGAGTLSKVIDGARKFLAHGSSWLVGWTAALTAAFDAGSRVMSETRGKLQALHELLNAAQADADKRLAGPELDALNESEAAERRATEELSLARDEESRLRGELQEAEAGRRLHRFISERSSAADYRKHLGLISLIRKDFETLGNLLAAVQKEARGGPGDAAQDEEVDRATDVPMPPVDRIVLYIDDLDRCQTDRVVQVLEAVHLLLAMPLFVVVVGVDARWLLRALTERYGNFLELEDHEPPREIAGLDGGESNGAAKSTKFKRAPRKRTTPQNYLEKIFQIPFSLPNMDEEGFGAIVEYFATSESEARGESPSTLFGAEVGFSAVDAAYAAAAEGGTAATPDDETSDIFAGAAAGVSSTGPGAKDEVANGNDGPSSGAGADAEDAERDSGTDQRRVTDAEANSLRTEGPRGYVAPEVVEALQVVEVTEDDRTEDDGTSDRSETAIHEAPPPSLAIPPQEIACMKYMHPLVGTPRGAGRFVNVYRLLRASLSPERERALLQGTDARPGPMYPNALLLTAANIGFAQQTRELMDIIGAPRAPRTTDGERQQDDADMWLRIWGEQQQSHHAPAGRLRTSDILEALLLRDANDPEDRVAWGRLSLCLAELIGAAESGSPDMPENHYLDDPGAYAVWRPWVRRFSFITNW